MSLRPSILALGATLLLSACASAPTHYYTLVSPMAAQGKSQPAATGFQFEMLAVRIPVQVDQPQLVVRQGDGSMAILETERWGSPLADEFHDALAADLEQRLQIRNLAGFPKAADSPVLSLRTEVRRFESAPTQYALIDVVWSLGLRNAADTRRNLTCSSVIRQPAGDSVESLVVAHQKAVATLADDIARTASQWVTTASTTCP